MVLALVLAAFVVLAFAFAALVVFDFVLAAPVVLAAPTGRLAFSRGLSDPEGGAMPPANGRF